MEIRIQDMSETKRGIQISAYVYHPVREKVPPLGDWSGETKAEKIVRLREWTEIAKEIDRKFEEAMDIYRRLHLGHATLIQEDLD